MRARSAQFKCNFVRSIVTEIQQRTVAGKGYRLPPLRLEKRGGLCVDDDGQRHRVAARCVGDARPSF
jgi:hypothetical protein